MLDQLNRRLEKQGFAVDQLDVKNIMIFNTDSTNDTNVAHSNTKVLQRQLDQEKTIKELSEEIADSTMQLQNQSAELIDTLASETSRIAKASEENVMAIKQQLDNETQKILSASEKILGSVSSDQDQLTQSSRQEIDHSLKKTLDSSRSEWEQRAEVDKLNQDRKKNHLRGEEDARLAAGRQEESTSLQKIDERQTADLADASEQAQQKQSEIHQREQEEISAITAREQNDLKRLDEKITDSEEERLASDEPHGSGPRSDPSGIQ
jgi:hypothetical protein